MEITNVEIRKPQWAVGKQIDEQGFCDDFIGMYPLVYVDGAFFSWRGMEPDSRVRKWVYDYIKPYYRTNRAHRVSSLVEILKMELQKEQLSQAEALIQCNNGCFSVNSGKFFNQLDQCRCRLPVNYNPKAPRPEKWLKFLDELLEPEDILTLQEFMGYCLLPVNYAQRMLLIIGRGGEGKSRIGVVASKLFGENMVNGSLTKLEKSPFARADLQHRLLMVDDDLQLEALTTTGNIKSIITAEQPMDLERKGVQSYQGKLFCRLMAFGNGNLRSLHDRSHGFFRRQIILSAKPRPEERVDDPYLAQRMAEETEGILLWCIEGVMRLLENKMRFTVSSRALQNLQEAEKEGNNTVDFMNSQGYIRLDREAHITSRQLYAIYTDWCEDNMVKPLTSRSFVAALRADEARYAISYTKHLDGGNGRTVRGFLGVRSMGHF